MTKTSKNQNFFIEKMRREKLPELVIDSFMHHYNNIVNHATHYIAESDIVPVGEERIPHYDSLLSYESFGINKLKNMAMVKLNGGLGTTMGLDEPKGFLRVKGALNFYDIIVKRIGFFAQQTKCSIPLVFMNSFYSEKKTNDYFRSNHTIQPISFMQHKFPKVLRDTFLPAQWPSNPELEWNPPGHGNIYTALETSGTIDKLLEQSIEYLFISNIDNLGATIDPVILGYFAKNNFPFLMEVVERSAMYQKGGHLAQLKDGQLVLREKAQVKAEELDYFYNTGRYCHFNSNSIWINLRHLRDMFSHHAATFHLPTIANEKTLDPADKNSPRVYQLEEAMGAAISLFKNAQAIRVPHFRYRHVKKCDDLLVLFSDCVLLTDTFEMRDNPQRTLPPVVISLDERYYGSYSNFCERFSSGAPSLLNCSSLTVKGDVIFGKNISINGSVTISNSKESAVTIPDNTTINKDTSY